MARLGPVPHDLQRLPIGPAVVGLRSDPGVVGRNPRGNDRRVAARDGHALLVELGAEPARAVMGDERHLPGRGEVPDRGEVVAVALAGEVADRHVRERGEEAVARHARHHRVRRRNHALPPARSEMRHRLHGIEHPLRVVAPAKHGDRHRAADIGRVEARMNRVRAGDRAAHGDRALGKTRGAGIRHHRALHDGRHPHQRIHVRDHGGRVRPLGLRLGVEEDAERAPVGPHRDRVGGGVEGGEMRQDRRIVGALKAHRVGNGHRPRAVLTEAAHHRDRVLPGQRPLARVVGAALRTQHQQAVEPRPVADCEGVAAGRIRHGAGQGLRLRGAPEREQLSMVQHRSLLSPRGVLGFSPRGSWRPRGHESCEGFRRLAAPGIRTQGPDHPRNPARAAEFVCAVIGRAGVEGRQEVRSRGVRRPSATRASDLAARGIRTRPLGRRSPVSIGPHGRMSCQSEPAAGRVSGLRGARSWG